MLEQAIDLEDRLGGGPDFVTRFAALMHDVGKPRTRRFQRRRHGDLPPPRRGRRQADPQADEGAALLQRRRSTPSRRLVELHLRFHGYGSGEWTDSAVRRYVRDAGDQLARLHVLTRADCTTRNQRKAERLRRTYDDLEARIARLAEQEELDAIRPDLDGNQIMEILGIGPGRGRRRGLPRSCSTSASSADRFPRTRPRPSCAPGGPGGRDGRQDLVPCLPPRSGPIIRQPTALPERRRCESHVRAGSQPAFSALF